MRGGGACARECATPRCSGDEAPRARGASGRGRRAARWRAMQKYDE
ncbi:hypothetical protein BMA721280_L0417 [Burkholderia mallei 2002721280]|uniref:Uncharacterized protein n=2 Tax=pseudomallei group TaxID=111527 RepID=A2RWK4_BURM9|nr:hypothetical protein BMA10229_0248 [Burkholderia mallei NCTC 10229]ABN94949.1 hypothetical protein BURPS1106A_A1757 [Burkholderia pseudomallei 1106a]ABO02481.1 hypothetical protein BMA10247_A1348 [Burkholderia mallei NCTC 10247]AFR19669.1 hypothetical protein BPC006_II1742 [Burkholderia pseudomallei BPC006]EBA46227.1 hypothetical protein BURPS305_1559 [Burkholderia pseudomallei 305]EDK55145.1 hypothetical protein BMAFMH_E0124 [Burkholderia mallei FMH]EDK61133.1 hypothetical protein BMAJHU_